MSEQCCTSKRFIGCFGSCDDIETGILTLQAGDHEIEVHWIDAIIIQIVNFEKAVEVIFPNRYNEYANITFKIRQPDGTYLVDGGDDCFEFSSSVKVMV